MLKKIVLFSFMFVCSSTLIFGQKDIVKSLQSNEYGKGKVRIFQAPEILNLLYANKADIVEKGDVKMIKTSGYRIQVYAGNNTRQAKERAESVAKEIAQYFPDITIYTPFISPRWLCRVGDFTSIEEADDMMRKIKKLKKFKETAIVREQILIPIE